MKKLLIPFTFYFSLFTLHFASAQNVGIGTNTPNPSAQLDVTSTNKGFLPPRMTYAQRNSIVNPAAGLMIYCTDCGAKGELQGYNGSEWTNMIGGPTQAALAVLTTTAVSSIAETAATSGGNITSDGGGTVTARGLVWSTSPNPTVALTTRTSNGSGTGIFTSNITGLTAGTTYYVRAYATNVTGTAYGNEVSFTTTQPAANLPSVTIGTQIWSSKNLDVRTYRNGEPIPQVTDPLQWQNLTTGAWCWYNNDSVTYAATYGRLYNWYAVNDPRGLAPQGWHVPTDAEWNKLVKYIDVGADTTREGSQSGTAGGSMKSTTGWNSPNTGATNSSGFNALPGGGRTNGGSFYPVGNRGGWWSASEYNAANAFFRFLYNDYSDISRYYDDKASGFSVRVVRD